MRHFVRLAVAGTAAALAVTACGGASDAVSGKSPQQLMQLAGTSVSQSSYRMTMHATMSIEAGGVQGLPGGSLDQLGSSFKNITIDGKADVQDAQHVRMTMSLKPLVDRQVVAVLFDDHMYVSTDDGKTFADGGSFNLQGLPVSPADLVSLLKDVAQVQDQGSTTRNGTKVEKLHATLPADYVSRLFAKAGSDPSTNSGQSTEATKQLLQLMSQAMSLKDGSVDAFVRSSDGKLDSSETKATIAIDMGKFMTALLKAIGGALPSGPETGIPQVSGSMLISQDAAQSFSDYGAKITVAKPTVDPNASPLPGLFGA
jgi:hypothetical protein